MAGISGKIIGLKINGVFTSCEISCQMDFQTEMLPASAVDSGRWKEFIAGVRGWTMQVNGNLLLEAVSSDIKALITTGYINGLPLFLQFSTRASSTIQMILSGAALLSAGNITSPITGSATWSANFQGTGELDTTYNDFGLLIDAMPSSADYPIILDEDQ